MATNKAVWCPGAVTTPRVADRRPGHLLFYSQEEYRSFVGLDDEYLESFCKAEDRTSLHSLESSKTLPRIFTAAMGAQGRRFRFRNRQKRPGEAAALALAAGQERQARPAVAAALSAIWEQGILRWALAVWCPGAVTTPRVADRRPGHLLSYSQEESRTFAFLPCAR